MVLDDNKGERRGKKSKKERRKRKPKKIEINK